jgi:hypothetical protein
LAVHGVRSIVALFDRIREKKNIETDTWLRDHPHIKRPAFFDLKAAARGKLGRQTRRGIQSINSEFCRAKAATQARAVNSSRVLRTYRRAVSSVAAYVGAFVSPTRHSGCFFGAPLVLHEHSLIPDEGTPRFLDSAVWPVFS